MRIKTALIAIAAAVAISTAPADAQGSCYSYSGVCSAVLGQGYSTYQTSADAFALNQKNSSFALDQVSIIKSLSPDCYNLYLNYTCSLYFPKCVSSQPEYQCKSLCSATLKACTSIFTLGGYANTLPNCVTLAYPAPANTPYPADNAPCLDPKLENVTVSSTSTNGTLTPAAPPTSSAQSCPPPLIPNPFNDTLNPPATCPGGLCCFPCPIYHALLPPNPPVSYYEKIIMVIDLLGTPLLIITFILVATRPHAFKESRYITILFSIINNILLIGIAGVLLANGPEKYMCDSPVADSVNNRLCTLQGVSYNLFALAFAMSEALFNINLFATLFFLRDPIPYKRVYVICIIFWILSAVLIGYPYAKSGSVHNFGSYCSPGDLSLYRIMGIYPLVVAVLISIVLGFGNVAFVLKMYIDILRGDKRYEVSSRTDDKRSGSSSPLPPGYTGNPRMDTFLLGWRPAILSLFVAVGFLVFVIWWFTDAEPKLFAVTTGGNLAASATDWGNEWLKCIYANAPNGHDLCSYIPKQHVPSETWTETTEIMAAATGIFYFIALGTNPADWRRVVGYLSGRRPTLTSAGTTASKEPLTGEVEGSDASLVSTAEADEAGR
ncbi:hypothetical protein HDU93_003202 [Gonapodya sp. JEL0774]|nr:hypothetical protein HDU93_003202 [Gonapodya sp. JEL0774]